MTPEFSDLKEVVVYVVYMYRLTLVRYTVQ